MFVAHGIHKPPLRNRHSTLPFHTSRAHGQKFITRRRMGIRNRQPCYTRHCNSSKTFLAALFVWTSFPDSPLDNSIALSLSKYAYLDRYANGPAYRSCRPNKGEIGRASCRERV